VLSRAILSCKRGSVCGEILTDNEAGYEQSTILVNSAESFAPMSAMLGLRRVRLFGV
jgi:hypothetical protein